MPTLWPAHAISWRGAAAVYRDPRWIPDGLDLGTPAPRALDHLIGSLDLGTPASRALDQLVKKPVEQQLPHARQKVGTKLRSIHFKKLSDRVDQYAHRQLTITRPHKSGKSGINLDRAS